ncbi:uncharacterized protein [Gossypium hirsutum]|uniref:Uncharacterized protein isoform X1 n=1 Tax=Gossypium hirsutum TaxID=3635 RepID=A0ABM3BPQ7_GOSHI|nr:uncharacterized protein LOC121229281 isoform X1 [Gossypium hirsutum]
MAVEANFASLFEKLKVEDPWLPPRTWESIPSQSGPLPPLPNSQPPISSSSSVSPTNYDIAWEATLVRLALNALQGVESSLCSIEKLSAAFFPILRIGLSIKHLVFGTGLQALMLWGRFSNQ